MMAENRKLIKDMTEAELISYRDYLYAQVKDFTMSAERAENVLKLMKKIKTRLNKGIFI